jgi:two-component system, LuxR family, sensor kinase FixL
VVVNQLLQEQGKVPARAYHFSLHSRDLLTAGILALGYYLSVQLGFALTLATDPVSILWPANAVVLAGLLLTSRRTWWLMLVAVLPAHFAAQIGLGVPWSMAACWYVANMTEALLGAALIRTYAGARPAFDKLVYVSVFLVAAILLAPLLSSFLDAGLVALAGWRYTNYWDIWRTRLFSNALATLMLVPLIVIGVQTGLGGLWRQTVSQVLELAALLVGICMMSAIVFADISPIARFVGHPYATLPFLIWAAVRYGAGGVSLCGMIIAAFAIPSILNGRGPFTAETPQDAAIMAQIYLIVGGSSMMLLAALLRELTQARDSAARRGRSLDLALDAAGMGTWEWDVRENRVTTRMPPQPLTVKRVSFHSTVEMLALVHESDRASVRAAFEQALETAGSVEVECRVRDKGETWRWILVKGRPNADAAGKPDRMSGLYLDTTERRSQEMQVRAQREQLAHIGRISTVGELSGAIAHELNQPLTAILVNARAALHHIGNPSPDLDEVKGMLEDIASDDLRAGEVIRRLRNLLVGGTIEAQPVNMNDCIREVLDLEHSDLIARHVFTELQLADDLPAVTGDRVQLQQVLLNLIVNARDAVSDDSNHDRRIRIASTREDGEVVIKVCDNGHGIADTDAIFHPFFTTKSHGLGMGLSICHSIVMAHGGSLSAINNQGGGATLHIRLPVAAPAGASGPRFRSG